MRFLSQGKTYCIFVLGEFLKDLANREKGVKWGGEKRFWSWQPGETEGEGEEGRKGTTTRGREGLRTGTKKCCKEEEEDGGSQQPDQGQILLQPKLRRGKGEGGRTRPYNVIVSGGFPIKESEAAGKKNYFYPPCCFPCSSCESAAERITFLQIWIRDFL